MTVYKVFEEDLRQEGIFGGDNLIDIYRKGEADKTCEELETEIKWLKKENERLRTEKEWLLKQYADELYDMHETFRKKYNRESIKQRVVSEMLQLLKKGK